MQRLQVAYDNLQQFKPGQIENEPADIQSGFNTEVRIIVNSSAAVYIMIVSLLLSQITKLVRCLSLLKEYVIECDDEYQDERGIPAHGKYVT